MRLKLIWISDDGMKPVGNLRSVESGWLPNCSFCDTPLTAAPSPDEGTAFIQLLNHIATH